MPMHPEVAVAKVTRVPVQEEPETLWYILTADAGVGNIWIRRYETGVELGLCEAHPKRIGIGARIFAAVAEDIAPTDVHGYVVEKDTVRELMQFSREAVVRGTVPIPPEVYEALPAFQFLDAVHVDVNAVEAQYDAAKSFAFPLGRIYYKGRLLGDD